MKFNLKKYILTFGIASVLLPSCNDDFMERYPLDEITDESFWKTETDLKVIKGFSSYNRASTLSVPVVLSSRG